MDIQPPQEPSDSERRKLLKMSLAVGTSLILQHPIKGFSAETSEKSRIENRPAHAKNRFLKSMNCSQAILETYAPEMGLSLENARKVAAAFAGGMGMGTECGAITGAFMVIGMKYGKTKDKDAGADHETFSRVAKFVAEFRKAHGEITCSELLGTDMGTPEGVKAAEAKGLFTTACPRFVETSAKILEKILLA
jgi:C_GCAxxG_C_C family probable redox protein